MNIHNIWSQGQLFAFSGLEGETSYNNDFTGILSGDKIGIKFFTKTRRELSVLNIETSSVSFKAVMGDLILADLDDNKSLKIIFYKCNNVVGYIDADCFINVVCEGESEQRSVDGVVVHNTFDGEYTALVKQGDKFSFAFAKSENAAINIAKGGLLADIDSLQNERMNYYLKHIKSEKYKSLYTKCLSVMKTQIYSPEGRFDTLWSTPDRLPHKALWFWDSIFHAIGYKSISPDASQQLILSLIKTQKADGMIPHMSDPYHSSDITQPPVLAWGAWSIYNITCDKSFLKTAFQSNKCFLSWCNSNRRPNKKWLYSWNTTDDINCKCDESGMDNSPRFDGRRILQAIDFSCFMANEMRIMALIADELGESAEYYNNCFESIKREINSTLWDEDEGFYYDYSLSENKLHKIKSVSSFLPLFAGVCDNDKATCLVGELQNPMTFATKCPIPCLAKNEKEFGTDMWRGPFWINYNYMIIQGLYNYGYEALGSEIRLKTIDEVNRQCLASGVIYEFYDSEGVKSPSKLNRKGAVVEPYNFDIRYQSIRDYGWSACLTLDMLENYYKETESDK